MEDSPLHKFIGIVLDEFADLKPKLKECVIHIRSEEKRYISCLAKFPTIADELRANLLRCQQTTNSMHMKPSYLGLSVLDFLRKVPKYAGR